MASRPTRRRRLLLATALAGALATEVTGFAVARSIVVQTAAAGTTSVSSVSASSGSAAGQVASNPRLVSPLPVAVGPAVASDSERDVAAPSTAVGGSVTGGRRPAPAVFSAVSARPRSSTPPRSTHPGSPASTHRQPTAPAYRGTNHVWIPWLGVSSAVQSFACSRSRAPDAGVYRWGCAGRNNVYLMGHAWSTFRSLHDAYVAGRLRKGLPVWYADGGGHVHEYRIAWWKLVPPTTAASWAWAPQTRPSMTLQTCVGANSQYRLMVRLTQVR